MKFWSNPSRSRGLVELIRKRVQERKHPPKPLKESVATILEREATITIKHWLLRVEKVDELNHLPLTENERTGYLVSIIKSIVGRLRKTRVIDAIASDSPKATAHGELRYHQGYTAPMIVQESRILQVCIFRDHPAQPRPCRLQPGAARRYADRRRSGLAVNTEHRELSKSTATNQPVVDLGCASGDFGRHRVCHRLYQFESNFSTVPTASLPSLRKVRIGAKDLVPQGERAHNRAGCYKMERTQLAVRSQYRREWKN